jgi:eukaryotic-like serine/threonine-protein kinase
MSQLEPGDALDHYRIDAVVARSGMSTLYRATDLRNGRQVALKVPHPEMESDPILRSVSNAKKRSASCWTIPAW